jgi:hypothetical protein
VDQDCANAFALPGKYAGRVSIDLVRRINILFGLVDRCIASRIDDKLRADFAYNAANRLV